jgi:hypothetical protein
MEAITESSGCLSLLFETTASANLRHLKDIAAITGIDAELVDLQRSGSLLSAVQRALLHGDSIVLDVASLQDPDPGAELDEIVRLVEEHGAAAMLLATEADEQTSAFLERLTNGAVQGVRAIGSPGSVRFLTDAENLTRELAGQGYPRKQKAAVGLAIAPGAAVDTIMSLDQQASFVRVRLASANIFVWSTQRIFDVFRPLREEKEFEDAADEYIPAIIFLRFAFGSRCWHNTELGAGIVIDDPLLTKRYGFIDFPILLASAKRHHYHVTVAYIPWNHWRSRAKDVEFFLEYEKNFSICAHGCDHTSNEFGSSDYEDLINRSHLARQRMERHRHRTRMSCEPLMVCPQEQYSLEALRSLSDSRQFLSVLNTACIPRNLEEPRVCAADLLLPAQDCFFGFPVFKRFYWNQMPALIMGLFLGKPPILVEHHDFFRRGPAPAEEFVSQLGAIRRGIRWGSLTETVVRTHLRRYSSENEIDIRFFTDTFKLDHGLEEPVRYRFLRRMPESTDIREVRIGGNQVEFSKNNGYLTFEYTADRRQAVDIDLLVKPVEPSKKSSPTFKYRASVALRRGLSEFRDNVVARNDYALRAARFCSRYIGGSRVN